MAEASFDNLNGLNLLIGRNGSGKTYFLKSLYAALKTVEQYRRGKEPRSAKELLADSLYWTFQTSDLGSLVRKGEQMLSFEMKSEQGELFDYSFGPDTSKAVQNLKDTFEPTEANSIFIPAKEIVSLQDVILRSYEVDKEFGFDKTYVDLARALSKTKQGRNYEEFANARKQLKDAIGGKLEYNQEKKVWIFKDSSRRTFELGITSEGIKRLAILDLLLGNYYLSRESVIIIDEAEANLHPEMIHQFMEILVCLAKAGLQVFISTHSYFVIKNLYILAHRHRMSIPTFSFTEAGVERSDLQQEMPENPIIRESINIYREEIDLP